jgi:hypothetical protein
LISKNWQNAALRLEEDACAICAGVRRGVTQAGRNEFIEEEEMDGRVRRMLRP